MQQVKKYILEQVAGQNLSQKDAKNLLLEIHNSDNKQNNDVAVIGIACNFADSDSPEAYWNHLENGESCMVEYPEERRKYFSPLSDNAHYAEFLGQKLMTEEEKKESQSVKAGYIKDIEMFDAGFFNIPPREARFMDPAQRLFLQTAWSAVEDGGYGGDRIVGTNTGVYVGRDCTSGTFYRFLTEPDPMHLTGTWEGILASRINYLFNLRGPSMVVDTACSSGLVAIHTASQALRNQECDMAIAGGISVGTSAQGNTEDGSDDVLSSVASTDNIVRTFDKKSTGTVFGEGVAALLLKPLQKALADGDHIYAVIKGSAANNDGASNGITSPNPIAQEEVITKAWEQAGINPETIGYIEAHGTGTLLGDPIEIKGLSNAFRKKTTKSQFCGIGSAKTNMGHLVGASGVAGILKVILSLKNKKIPASLHFEEPNPHIPFTDSPLYVVDRLTTWEKGEHPRRGGVSGFGFSGTNCHIVLEEAPERIESSKEAADEQQMLTLSGKSKEALVRIVDRYNKYLAGSPSASLAQICYTSNTGRGHFDYRLSVVARNVEELRSKIAWVHREGLESIQDQPDIYFGKHKVVSDKKKLKDEGEISESERRILTEKGKQVTLFLTKIHTEPETADPYRQLGKLYVEGAMINWSTLYQGQAIQKVSLPVYPFERTPYWGEIKVSKLKAAAEPVKEGNYPLIDRCILKSYKQEIYSVSLNTEKHWVLKDHMLFGTCIVPGTAYVEIAREIGKRYYPNGGLELKDIIFLSPVSVREEEYKEVQFIVQRERDHLHLIVASEAKQEEEAAGTWTAHMEVDIYPMSDVQDVFYPLEQLQNQSGRRELIVDNDALTNKSGRVTFGPRWLNVVQVYLGEKDVVAELNIPEAFISDLEQYGLHPGMLDNAVNAATQSFGEGMYLPLSYKNFKFYRAMPERFYTHIRKIEKESKNKETIKFNISLTDMDGKVFAEIEEYTIKRIQVKQFKESNQLHHYYKTSWVAAPTMEEAPAFASGEKVLILKQDSEFTRSLMAEMHNKGMSIVEAQWGEAYEQIDDNHIIIDGTESGYRRMFEDLAGSGIHRIIHTLSLAGEQQINELFELKQAVKQGVDSLYHLSRAYVQSKVKQEFELIILTDNAHEVNGEERVIHPHNAALLGLTKVVAQEFPELSCRSIEIDPNTSAERVIAELGTTAPSFRIAYRENERYTEQLGHVDWDQVKSEPVEITADGVYVITGGTGGIGLALARHLASKQSVRLGLINRSQLPDKKEWATIIEQGEQKSLVDKLLKIQEIEKLGSEVLCISADLSNEDEVTEALSTLRHKFGRISGVFHGAGVAGDGFLIRKEKGIFDEVIHPKLYGTWLLDHLTREDHLDFFISFSSIATLFGSRGQGDYTAANSYLDAFSSQRRRVAGKTATVNWPAWSEVGMAVDYNISEDVVLFRSVNNERAFEVISQLLETDLSNVIPGEINLTLLSAIEPQLPMSLSRSLRKMLSKHQQHAGAAGGSATPQPLGEITFSGKGEDEYTETERTIAYIYARGLNMPVIDIYESFNAMGGDSIMATELLKYIDREYPDLVDISDMFTYSNVAEMAEYIDTKRGVIQPSSAPENKDAREEEYLDQLLGQFETGDADMASVLEFIAADLE
jgi:iturin family lipopeptide synthetase A